MDCENDYKTVTKHVELCRIVLSKKTTYAQNLAFSIVLAIVHNNFVALLLVLKSKTFENV